MASRLAEIAEIDTEHFAEKMFQAGSVLNEMSPEQILNYDFKDYRFDKCRIGIGQVNSSSSSDIEHAQEKLLDYLKKARKQRSYDLLMLMITDIVRNGSLILFSSDGTALPRAVFGKPDSADGAVFADDVISRKKQVVPLISDAVRSLSIT